MYADPTVALDEMIDSTRRRADRVTSGIEQPCTAREVNLLKPSTPFMRDHLKVIWTGFIAWALLTFGNCIIATGSRPIEIQGSVLRMSVLFRQMAR